jgi:elongation factor Ts
VAAKIVEGKLDKFYSEVCLLEQASIRDSSQTVDALVKAAVAKMGENLQVKRFVRFELGEE